MVAMPSLHFFRWTAQLKDAGHEVFWFDVVDGGEKIPRISWVQQIVGWKYKWNFQGRYFLKKKLPKLYAFIARFNTRDTATVFEEKLLQIQPDLVHSFALYVACTPIIKVMEKHKHLKWIYSSWGSDLFYFQNNPAYLKDIKRVLPRVNFLFTDCSRDFKIAKTHGFVGEFLGVFPGGGGFPLLEMQSYSLPLEQRKTILIKGFQGRSGRAITVLKAVQKLKKQLKAYKIIVFGADAEVIEYVTATELVQWNNFTILGKIAQNEVWQLMGKSIIYIGNSNSDGMPNTLLEAICMDVFPIQSNPGGVTEEIITQGKNGFLIEDCEDVKQIIKLLLILFNKLNLIENAIYFNQQKIKPKLDRGYTNKQVLKSYLKISKY